MLTCADCLCCSQVSFQGKKVDARRVANVEGSSSDPIYIGMKKGYVQRISQAQSRNTFSTLIQTGTIQCINVSMTMLSCAGRLCRASVPAVLLIAI